MSVNRDGRAGAKSLSNCNCHTDVSFPVNSRAAPGVDDALPLWDNNSNDRITGAEARVHGIAPVRP